MFHCDDLTDFEKAHPSMTGKYNNLVASLTKPYQGKNCVFAFDRAFGRPSILAYLLSKRTRAVCTMNANSVHVPQKLRWTKNKCVDTMESLQSGELTLIRHQGKRSKSYVVGSTLTASETKVVDIKRKFRGEWKQMKVNKPTATAEHYNKQMCWVDACDQLKSYTEVELRFRKWTVRCCITVFVAAIINVRALWIFYTNPRKKAQNVVDFFDMMLELLLDYCDAPKVAEDYGNHWIVPANQERSKRLRCVVCRTKKPNTHCNKCANNPVICMGCAEKYHADPSLYIRKQKRRRPSDALDSAAPSSDVEPSDSEMNDDD